MANMELKEFIHRVRDEIQEAYNELPERPTLSLKSIELEVAFSLSGTGAAKGKLFVVDLEGEISHERTHKVTLTLEPIVQESSLADGLSQGRLGRKIFPIAGIEPTKDKTDF